MPQPRFERLSERLLKSGIAPRHVRRYVRELGDHFDDLVREETAGGAARELAETRALYRLGNDDDLAEAMLSRPELRSLAARFPWAVFGLGPIALLALGFAAALAAEIGIIELATAYGSAIGLKPGPDAARWFTRVLLVWNTFAVYFAPLAFAALLYLVGSRQRMRPAWIVTGVALVCILGGFQNLIFYDTGCRGCGHLLVQSAFIPPFPHFAEGVARAAMNLAIAGGFWWLSVRKRASAAMALSHTAQT
ncbi:MAG: hypothetical protein V4527_10990 [Pseudomonadota bacterium]